MARILTLSGSKEKNSLLVGGLTFTVDCEHRGYFSYILFFSFFFNFSSYWIHGISGDVFSSTMIFSINFYGFCSFDFACCVFTPMFNPFVDPVKGPRAYSPKIHGIKNL